MPCFVTVSDEINRDHTRRSIRILTEEDQITPANLGKLMRYFSGRYAEVEDVSVSVETSLNFLLGNYLTQDDIEGVRCALSGVPHHRTPKVWEKDAQAYLERKGTTETIRYKAKGGDPDEITTVVLKAARPSCADCAGPVPNQGLGAVNAMNPAQPESQPSSTAPCFFVIREYSIGGKRFVQVFINRQHGGPAGLVALLDHFSKAYGTNEPLTVKVYTDIQQSSEPYVPMGEVNFAAALFNDGQNEVVRFRRPGHQVKTIVVKGADIFSGLDDMLGTLGYVP
ncbi:MAG TPA: hypothetical protein VJX67_09955 [Blastocatellia bacterium]|nr:hypothetical protein [Blastocatellia bacterium]